MKKTNKIRSIIMQAVFILVCSFPYLVMAQPADPPPNPDTPIDGGLGLLLVAGVGYGVKRFKDRKSKDVVN